MIHRNDNQMSMTKQCQILSLTRSHVYYKPVDRFTPEVIKTMHTIDEIYTEHPEFGYRRIFDELQELGYLIGRDQTLTLMREMGIEALYPRKKRNTTIVNKEHKIYPYLLRDISITGPNQVWAADITYIPLQGRFCYLIAIIDWYSRMILSYRISNALDVSFCEEALNEALTRFGKPEIFNTDQGCQFTSYRFTEILHNQSIQISMNSKGRALDNVIIERFFRTLKYENVYLKHYATIKELKAGVEKFIEYYNRRRKHSSLNKKTPSTVYYGQFISLN